MTRPLFELVAFGTERDGDIRFRSYTRSEDIAAKFSAIPRIDFTDSGHGIVFRARTVSKRKPRIMALADYVREHLGQVP